MWSADSSIVAQNENGEFDNVRFVTIMIYNFEGEIITMGREERIKVFEDTTDHYWNDETLRRAVENSIRNQKLVLESDTIRKDPPLEMMGKYLISDCPRDLVAEITVSKKRSFEAASVYAREGLRVAVHNFASASNPGGGVLNGASAQEECLCRCSTLYPCLSIKEMWDGFYTPHRAMKNPVHNGDIIYTPGVVVFKTDTDLPELMPSEDWYRVDVITCAAPNLRDKPSNAYNPSEGASRVNVSDAELLDIHVTRLDRILSVASVRGCDAVILGAFGCGAFMNPPRVAAEAARIAVDKHRNEFKVIEFAVYCGFGDDRNYREFEKAFNI